jgi:hypothetical protein
MPSPVYGLGAVCSAVMVRLAGSWGTIAPAEKGNGKRLGSAAFEMPAQDTIDRSQSTEDPTK